MSIKQTLEYLKAKRNMRNKMAAAYYPYLYKSAAQPPMDPSMAGGPPPGGDPSMGGMPPGDPSMGGMPPGGDPSMMGGAPPMDPSMMGGMPPMDPSMKGGMPPMDPSMMGGMMPPMMPPQGQTPQETEQKVTNKVKTEQWMQHIDSYNYNLLKLMINLYEHLGIPVPAESLIPQPLGQSAPSAGDISGMMGAAANATSPQSPTDAMAEGDVTPPNAGGGMDPSMMGGMDPSMMGGDPSQGGMDPSMMGGDPSQGGGAPPMEGGDVKQSSWNLYNPYTGRLNSRWRSPMHKQAGVRPYNGQVKQANAFRYPQGYNDIMAKLNNMYYYG